MCILGVWILVQNYVCVLIINLLTLWLDLHHLPKKYKRKGALIDMCKIQPGLGLPRTT